MELESTNDAFGQSLLDVLAQKPAQSLTLEMADGWHTPAMAPAWFFQPSADWDPWEKSALDGLTGPVLDLGCGAGRASLYLQSRGLDVTAVDFSAGAVEVCNRQGLLDARQLDFLDEIPGDKNWNAVLLLCGNLGLAGGWDQTQALLRNLANVCSDDAVLIGDTVDPTVYADDHARQYQAQMVEQGRYIGDVQLRLRYGDIVGDWWWQSNFRFGDLEALVQGTGWIIVEHQMGAVDHRVKLVRSG